MSISRRPVQLLATLVALVTFVALPSAAQAEQMRGVQLHSLWPENSTAEMDRELDMARDSGANSIRVDVVWGSLETGGKGQYSPWYVEKLDRLVAGADARGIKVLAGLWSSPCWASSAPESVKQGCSGAWWDRGVGAYPPSNPADYGDAARFVTNRYGTKLTALEVWNEPNLAEESFWKAADKPAAYAALLKAAYPRAKAGNAAVPVLAGATAFADRPFFEALYSHGIKGFHDGLSFHPYNEWRHPSDRWQDQWKKYTLLPGIEWIRDLQRKQGDEKPLWATEFGWSTGTASGWRVTEAQQATFIRDSFPLLAQIDYLKGAFVYNLREKGNDPASHEDNFGLVNKDFTPKPAYAALRAGLTAAGTTPPPGGGVTLPNLPPIQPPKVNPPVVPPVALPGGLSGTSGTPKQGSPRPAAPRTRPVSSRRARPRFSLRVVRRRAVLYAVGRAKRGASVRLRLSGCRRMGARTFKVRAGRRGSYRKRLGAAARLKGCRISASVPGAAGRRGSKLA